MIRYRATCILRGFDGEFADFTEKSSRDSMKVRDCMYCGKQLECKGIKIVAYDIVELSKMAQIVK